MADGPDDNVTKLHLAAEGEPAFKLCPEHRAWLHDQFALAALPALVASKGAFDSWSFVATSAYDIADAMMAERAKRN